MTIFGEARWSKILRICPWQASRFGLSGFLGPKFLKKCVGLEDVSLWQFLGKPEEAKSSESAPGRTSDLAYLDSCGQIFCKSVWGLKTSPCDNFRKARSSKIFRICPWQTNQFCLSGFMGPKLLQKCVGLEDVSL